MDGLDRGSRETRGRRFVDLACCRGLSASRFGRRRLVGQPTRVRSRRACASRAMSVGVGCCARARCSRGSRTRSVRPMREPAARSTVARPVPARDPLDGTHARDEQAAERDDGAGDAGDDEGRLGSDEPAHRARSTRTRAEAGRSRSASRGSTRGRASRDGTCRCLAVIQTIVPAVSSALKTALASMRLPYGRAEPVARDRDRRDRPGEVHERHAPARQPELAERHAR